MGGSINQSIKRIIYVDPKGYSNLSSQDKYALARLIGLLNKKIANKQEVPTMLVAPGRVGSSTPSLGLPVTFSEISNISIICETAYEIMGMVPDLSFGSHFFQDLVEEDIFYVAIFPNSKETIFNVDLFENSISSLKEILPKEIKFESVLKVIDAISGSN